MSSLKFTNFWALFLATVVIKIHGGYVHFFLAIFQLAITIYGGGSFKACKKVRLWMAYSGGLGVWFSI